MELVGKIKVLFDTQQISAKFRKRELVLITQERFPQQILIEFTQDRISLLDNVRKATRSGSRSTSAAASGTARVATPSTSSASRAGASIRFSPRRTTAVAVVVVARKTDRPTGMTSRRPTAPTAATRLPTTTYPFSVSGELRARFASQITCSVASSASLRRPRPEDSCVFRGVARAICSANHVLSGLLRCAPSPTP